jgi:hypothetical protein
MVYDVAVLEFADAEMKALITIGMQSTIEELASI